MLCYVLARVISIALHHPEFVVPAATIIVGLHFLCFVPLYRSKGYYLTTAVFCLTAVASVLIVPLTFTIGPLQVVNGWQLANGCVCVLWLWAVAIRHVITGYALWHQLQIKFTWSESMWKKNMPDPKVVAVGRLLPGTRMGTADYRRLRFLARALACVRLCTPSLPQRL